jgi:hypothetical protein
MTPTESPVIESDETTAPFAFAWIAAALAWIVAILAWIFWFRGYA